MSNDIDELMYNTMTILEYIVLDNDIVDLYSFISDKKYEKYFDLNFIKKNNRIDKSYILDELKIDTLSYKQRALLFIYSHLYYFLCSFPLVENMYLVKIRDKLALKEEAVKYVFSVEDLELLNEYKKNPNKILTVLEPDEKLFRWINKKIISMTKKGYFINKKYLTNLKFDEYQHKADYEARNILEVTPGISVFAKFFFKNGLDRIGKIQYLGSNYKMNASTGYDEYKYLVECCKILDVKIMPDLYVEQGFLNASTVGDEETAIILTSGCFSLLNYEELLFIYGHELGHIKSKHVLYHQMAQIILNIGKYAGAFTLGFNELLTSPLKLAILDWYRKSEFTSDRAGLLACQNIKSAITCMMKLSGYPIKYYKNINPEEMLYQAKEFDDYMESSNLNTTLEKIMLMDDSHPWLISRCKELVKWYDSGEYNKLLELHSKNNIIIDR